MMKRRTGVRGLRNWLLLIGGSIALGAIGIWSMHFIAMMSCRLTDDQGNELMMAFEPGLTVVSLLVAVVIVAAGFLLAGEPHKVKVWRTCIVGVVGGCGVSVMHYLGPRKQTNGLAERRRKGRGRCGAPDFRPSPSNRPANPLAPVMMPAHTLCSLSLVFLLRMCLFALL